MASRFASISDEEVKEFTEKLENENTKKKTRRRIFSVCYKAQPYLQNLTTLKLNKIGNIQYIVSI